jgi:hypothetical protein
LDTQVQFNDAGAFGGNAGFVFIKGTATLQVTNVVAVSTLLVDGQVWLDSHTPSTGLGTPVASFPVFDSSGTLLGHVPIYDTV